MNSAVRPSFKVIFAKFCTCGSCEQCMGPIEKKMQTRKAMQTRCYQNPVLIPK